jgi:Ca2+-binding EF-hand superfamily protein
MVANAGGVIKLFVGIYMCTVGIMSVLVSLKTVKEISVLEEKIQQAETVELELTGINPRKSPEFITKQFGLYDSNGDGFITQSELQHLCKSLGSPLDEEELKHALQILDPSNTQAIEAQDFVAWFGGQDISFV